MAKDEDVRTYTADELRQMVARGEDQTDFAALDAMSEEQLERAIASDPDWKDVPRDWYKGAEAVPARKQMIAIRLDPDVLAFFRGQGRGWQTRVNAVLRAYVEAVSKAR
jgi:uncharacterized protein (DUF4415 family)